MKKDREVLESELSLIFDEYSANKEVVNKVKTNLAEHGISLGTTQGLLNKSLPMETQSQQVLYLLTHYLYVSTERESINPKNYFNDKEIEEGNAFKREVIEQEEYTELYPVLQIRNDQWITRMTRKEIADLWNYGKARYNKRTQRNTIIREYKNKMVEKVNINKTAIKKIYRLMKEDTYIPNMVTFNIPLSSDENLYEYDDKSLKMRISSILHATDGFHRDMAILGIVADNINPEEYMEVRITHFSEDKCHTFMLQEDIRNPLDARFKKSIEDSYENSVVKQLNEKGELKGKITTNLLIYTHNEAYVLYDTMLNTIDDFQLKNQRDANKLVDYLVEGFTEIIGIFYDDFNNLEKSRKENVKTLSSTFIGYVALLESLKDIKDWKVKLEDVLNKIDFNLVNPIWTDENNTDFIKITESNPSKSTIKRIKKYFKDQM